MALAKLRELAARAGRWLGVPAPPPRQTTAIPGDRFDEMTWAEILEQAGALRDLIEELRERHDYAADLVRDIFLAAYKVDPQVRDSAEMDPSRLVNRQIVASVLGAPDFSGLRRDTAGDPYASAMAVLAQAGHLRQLAEQAEDAQRAADADAAAGQAERDAAEAVRLAMADAQSQTGADGGVPDAAAAAVNRALAEAEQTGQAAASAAETAAAALRAAEGAMRTAARQAAAQAGEGARAEAALMDAWGIGPGELRKMDFEQRRRLAERLAGGRLRDLASLIGRFRRMAAGERARRVEGAPGALTGVTVSADLGRLIPSEMAALGVPAARAVFAARLAESRLLTYQTTGVDRIGQGAVIAVVDSSDSMSVAHAGGVTREAWSKAVVLSLLDQARAGRRDMVVIYFGAADELKIFRFPATSPIAIGDVVEMAEFFFAGGTDFEAPLGAAADLLEAEFLAAGENGGDIVWCTDGVCGVSEQFTGSWQARKAQAGFRVWGISLGRSPAPVMTALCDNVRGIEDLADPGEVADMFRVI